MSGQTVGYFVLNPNAQYIQADPGALAKAGGNIPATLRTNKWDLTMLRLRHLHEARGFGEGLCRVVE
jgi:hypothetical protein